MRKINTPKIENTFSYETKVKWLGKEHIIYRKTSESDTPEIMQKPLELYRLFNFVSFLILPTIITVLIFILFF